MYLYYWMCLWRNSTAVPRKTAKGLKIKQHIPLQIGPTLQWCSVYLPLEDQSGVFGRIHSLYVFSPERTEQTLARVVLWTSARLSPSVLSCSLPSRTYFCSAMTKRQKLVSKCTYTWLISLSLITIMHYYYTNWSVCCHQFCNAALFMFHALTFILRAIKTARRSLRKAMIA